MRYNTYSMHTHQYHNNCQYYYSSSVVKNQISNGVSAARILLPKSFTNITTLAHTMHRRLQSLQLYFVVVHLVYVFISLVNHSNVNKLKIFPWFKYLLNCWLNDIQRNHVDLLSSDVQHNDGIHFVMVSHNNVTVFNLFKMNSRSKTMLIHVTSDSKWLLLIEFCLKLLIMVYFNINSTNMDDNNQLYHQNIMIDDFINHKMDENVSTVIGCIVKLTIDKIVTFDLFEHLFYPWFYSLTLWRHIMNHYSQKLSQLNALKVKNVIFLMYDANSVRQYLFFMILSSNTTIIFNCLVLIWCSLFIIYILNYFVHG